MQLRIRRRDRLVAVAHGQRLDETLWHEPELRPSQELCLLYEMAVRGGQGFRQEGGVPHWQVPPTLGAMLVRSRLFVCRASQSRSDPRVRW